METLELALDELSAAIIAAKQGKSGVIILTDGVPTMVPLHGVLERVYTKVAAYVDESS